MNQAITSIRRTCLQAVLVSLSTFLALSGGNPSFTARAEDSSSSVSNEVSNSATADPLQQLFKNNQTWVAQINKQDPKYFANLAKEHNPDYLWIGCSDSRVPANQVVGLDPGELFVHRNVANMVYPIDMNVLSVLEYAVDVLQVTDIIVCGHHDCGGVQAALKNQTHGLIDNWLLGIKRVYAKNQAQVDAQPTFADQANLLAELNVKAQVNALVATSIVQNAWARGQKLTVHGFVFDLPTGQLKDLGVNFQQASQVAPPFRIQYPEPAPKHTSDSKTQGS